MKSKKIATGKIEFIINELKKKGYPLENYVQSLLVKNGWHVQPNSYFMDKDTGQGRELDIKAVFDEFESNSWSNLHIKLLIQCRKLPGNAWVFFPSPATLYKSVMKCGLVDFLKRWDNDVFIAEGTHVEKSRVAATNYCEIVVDERSSNKRVDNIWESTITLIKATSQEMEWSHQDQKQYLEGDLGSYEAFKEEPFEVIWLIYPLIIFEGEIFSAKFSDEEIAVERSDYVQLFVDYVSGTYKGKFWIDVINKERFSEYLRYLYEDLTIFNLRRVKSKQKYEKSIHGAIRDYFKKQS